MHRSIVLLALVAIIVLPASARAVPGTVDLHRCQTLRIDNGDGTSSTDRFGAGWQCGTVHVVKNRLTGRGSIGIRTAFYHRPGPPRPTLVALAGGPGQGAFQYSLVFRRILAPLLDDHDLLVFDQRGTGGSGYLNLAQCTGRRDNVTGYDRCLRKLGDDRYSYRTADSVEDMESLRVALGLPSLLPIGVSYGTKVAGDYARSFPSTTEAVVLDSPLAPTGLDPWARDSLGGAGRIFDQLCQLDACPFTASARTDFETLLRRTARTGSLSARLPWGRGGQRTLKFSQERLLELLFNADFDPVERLALPGFIYSAVHGDRAPLVRYLGELASSRDQAARRQSGYSTGVTRAERLYPDSSDLLYVATTCTDLDLPWRPGATRAQARAGLKTALALTDLASFFGWNKRAIQTSSVYRLCAGFGGFGGPAPQAAPYPSVRTLVMVGSDDIRTTLENARQYEALGATVLPVPRAGHSVLTGGSGCARRALRRFVAGGAIDQCRPITERVPADKPTVERTTQLDGSFERQILSAVAGTIVASYESNPIELFSLNRSGLRGGWFRVSGTNGQSAVFHRYRYYRDLSISGSVSLRNRNSRIRLRISGRTNGTVTAVSDGERLTLVGRFGSRVARYDFGAYLERLNRRTRERRREYVARAVVPTISDRSSDGSSVR